MTHLKKWLSLSLALLMLLSSLAAFVGCANGSETDGESTAGSEVENESDQEDNRFLNVNYDDRVFSIYTCTHPGDFGTSNFLIEGTAKTEGNMVNDAVLERNITVEELLHVKLEFTQTDLLYTEVPADIRTLTQSGSHDFDLVINSIFAFSELLIEGNFRNVMDESCVFDFERNYWYTDFMEDLRLMNGYQYILAGDYFSDIIRSAHLLLVNKDLYRDYYMTSADELYDVVSNYEWTFDKLNTVCSDIYYDMNSNNTVDKGDRFGFTTASFWGGAIPFMISGNPTFISRDDDGLPSITIHESERSGVLANKLTTVFNNESASIGLTEVDDLLTAFTQGECLVLGYQRLGSLENTVLRSMEGDAAVLPYPMLYAADKKYTTSTHDTTAMGAILTTAQDEDLEYISTVIEVLCRETANIVMPRYYKESLQVQCVDDEKAAAMIDIIHDNFGQSFILAYNSALGGNILQSFTTCIESKREFSAVFTSGSVRRANRTLSNKIALFEKKNQIG